MVRIVLLLDQLSVVQRLNNKLVIIVAFNLPNEVDQHPVDAFPNHD